MKQTYPGVLWLLLLLIPIIFIGLIGYIKGKKSIQSLAMNSSGRFYRAYGLRYFLYYLTLGGFFIFSIFSLVDYRWGKVVIKEDREGLDIVFALDCSNSMQATDIYPTRFASSKDALFLILKAFEGERFGLTLFKGESETFVPVTEDVILIESLINYLEIDMLRSRGSNIENGLIEAIRAFPEESNRHKIIILISDGGALEGNASRIVREMYDMGISLFILGVGGEGYIPLVIEGKAVKNNHGHPVSVRQEVEYLSRLAEEAEGFYQNMEEPNGVGKLIDNIKSYFLRSSDRGFQLRSPLRYRVFLWPALIFLLSNMVIRRISWRDL